MKGLPPPPSSVATCLLCKINTISVIRIFSLHLSSSLPVHIHTDHISRIFFLGVGGWGWSVSPEGYSLNLTSITVWYLMRWFKVHAHLKRIR